MGDRLTEEQVDFIETLKEYLYDDGDNAIMRYMVYREFMREMYGPGPWHPSVVGDVGRWRTWEARFN